MRVRCVLFGCWYDQNSSCPKCGAALYDADFIQVGRMDWVHKVRGKLSQIRAFVNRKCNVCGKRYWFTANEPCCSEECYEDYIPF